MSSNMLTCNMLCNYCILYSGSLYAASSPGGVGWPLMSGHSWHSGWWPRTQQIAGKHESITIYMPDELKTMSGQPPSQQAYLRPPQVAKLFGVSLRTVASWQQRRVLPHIKVGRVVLFRRDDIDRALNRFRFEAIGGTPRQRTSRPQEVLWSTTVA